MTYIFETTKKFDRMFKKLSKNVQLQIADYMEMIESLENPRSFGKELKGNRKGQWRYRTGDYRIICEIKDDKLVILALEVGNRSDIYL
jgi:mRNA interferase RelE/StbE